MSTPNATILLVEDDPNDVLFLKMAFESIGVENPIVESRDGREAQDYLAGKGGYADRGAHPLPYLLLLDLKLPQLMGLDLLNWIRRRSELDSMIVVVLTSSANPTDVDRAYQLGANAYVVKPSRFEKLQAVAKSIKEFWLRNNQPGSLFYNAKPAQPVTLSD